jgi:NTE family protein
MATRAPGQGVPRAQWLRRLARGRRELVAFALSGGGPFGALQVGALKALFEHGTIPDLVTGTSCGALNAALVAFDPTPSGIARLEQTWTSLAGFGLFSTRGLGAATWARLLVRGDHVFDNSGMKKMIEVGLGHRRFEDATIPLAVVATDLETGAEEIFSSGDLTVPLLASAAMPGIFPPVRIGDRLYIDGGVTNNVPITPAVTMGATTVYVLDSTAQNHVRRPLDRPLDYLTHAFSLARAQRLKHDLSLYEDTDRIVVVPMPRVDFYIPFASVGHSARLMEQSYSHTMRWLESRDKEGEPERRSGLKPAANGR